MQQGNSPNTIKDVGDGLIFRQASPMLPINESGKKKDIPSILYDYDKWEEEWEISQYYQFMKKHDRLYKQLHTKYTNALSVKKPKVFDALTFDGKKEKADEISVLSLIKLIKDFRLENSLSHALLKEQVNKLVKAINQFILQSPGDLLSLSFEGF